MNENAQKVIEIIRSKTNAQWWKFHGSDIERAVSQAIAYSTEDLGAVNKHLYAALIEARAMIGSFIRGEDLSPLYIDSVNKQIEAAVEAYAGGPVDAAGDRIAT